MHAILADLAKITGQKAVICKAKKSVANFKLREGMPIGAKVTLRGERMYEFVDRLFSVCLLYTSHRLRESHGTGPVSRHAGSMGSCSTPSRVFKGKRLPGHLGAERVTVQNLKFVKVDTENNLIAIKGAIPGPKGSVVCIHDSVKA